MCVCELGPRSSERGSFFTSSPYAKPYKTPPIPLRECDPRESNAPLTREPRGYSFTLVRPCLAYARGFLSSRSGSFIQNSCTCWYNVTEREYTFVTPSMCCFLVRQLGPIFYSITTRHLVARTLRGSPTIALSTRERTQGRFNFKRNLMSRKDAPNGCTRFHSSTRWSDQSSWR